MAARPKTLTGAMIPVLLAGALALHDGLFEWRVWTCCALFACLMQVVANFINDLFDYEKGSDRDDRLGPERACAQGWITLSAMRWGIFITIILACTAGCGALYLTWQQLPYDGLELVGLGLLCVVFAFLYTSHLSYLGFGDILVLVFFGLVPVCATYYLMAFSVTYPVVVASLVSGIAIDALLVVNNYRDVDQDRLSGKRTLFVRYGKSFGQQMYLYIGFLVAWLIMLLGICYFYSENSLVTLLLFTAVAIIYITLHFRTWQQMVAIDQGRALNTILGQTSRNMFIMALLLSLVIVL